MVAMERVEWRRCVPTQHRVALSPVGLDGFQAGNAVPGMAATEGRHYAPSRVGLCFTLASFLRTGWVSARGRHEMVAAVYIGASSIMLDGE